MCLQCTHWNCSVDSEEVIAIYSRWYCFSGWQISRLAFSYCNWARFYFFLFIVNLYIQSNSFNKHENVPNSTFVVCIPCTHTVAPISFPAKLSNLSALWEGEVNNPCGCIVSAWPPWLEKRRHTDTSAVARMLPWGAKSGQGSGEFSGTECKWHRECRFCRQTLLSISAKSWWLWSQWGLTVVVHCSCVLHSLWVFACAGLASNVHKGFSTSSNTFRMSYRG